jgi:hypothetical protein
MQKHYWTPEGDEELKRHEAAGLSASKIAALLGTTRNAVLGRLNRLRGKLFESDVNRHQLRRKAANGKPRKVHQAKIFAAMRTDLAAGIDRDTVIKRALDAYIGHHAIGEFFGLSPAQVYQIAGPRRNFTKWTKEQIELMVSMWPTHSTLEIATAVGSTPRIVYGKLHKLGLRRRNSRNGASAPEHLPETRLAPQPTTRTQQ